MLHTLEWEGGNKPDANFSMFYIPWSGEGGGGNEPDANFPCVTFLGVEREGMSQMPISPCVTFLGVEREGMSQMPISPCVTFLGVGRRE